MLISVTYMHNYYVIKVSSQSKTPRICIIYFEKMITVLCDAYYRNSSIYKYVLYTAVNYTAFIGRALILWQNCFMSYTNILLTSPALI